MKRSPLVRRSELARGPGPARVSARRRGEQGARRAVCAEVDLRDGEGCSAAELVPEVACWGPIDHDEVAPRGVRPGGHLDPTNVQQLCRGHHDWKTTFPAEAHARGLRRWSWEA